jgi:SAM-dependent methyltransferase
MELADLQKNWNEFGKRDPLWAILTDPAKQGNRWSSDEFFQTGRREITALLAHLHSLSIAPPTGRALDFGCGVGRLTQALAMHFDSVTGIDIAPSMLELAERYNAHGPRCSYLLNEENNLHIFAEDTFAFVYSNYTLQHMPPEHATRYITEFIRVLRPGGIAVFQLPSATVRTAREHIKAALPPRLLHLARRVSHGTRTDGPTMETHVMAREVVEGLLTASGAQVIHVLHNPRHDRRWTSLLYYAAKPALDHSPAI